MTPAPTVGRFLGHVEQRRNADALDLVLREAERGARVSELVADQLAPVQCEVGERWHAGTYSVVQEHLTSAVVEDALGLLTRYLPRVADAPRVALVCALDEWHVTPARMAALALRDAGWQVDFLGASTPADHLRQALAHTTPQVLAISATLPLSLRGVPPLVEVARSLDIPVVAGGAAFGTSPHRALVLGADAHAPDVATADTVMRGWLDRPPTPVEPAADDGMLAERQRLELDRDQLVDRALGRLRGRLPTMADLDDRQLVHTRRDLDYTLQFLETAMLVDDPSLVVDYVTWLDQLLVNRGLPAHVLPVSLEVLGEVLGDELSRARAMLRIARRSREQAVR